MVKPSRRSIVQMIGSDELPGARHVLDDNARIAGQMFADMARHHAAVSVESAAGSGADEHYEVFPLKNSWAAAGTTAIRSSAAEKMTFAERQSAKLMRTCSNVIASLSNYLPRSTCARGEVRQRPASHRRNPSALVWFARPSPASKRARGRCFESRE